MEDKNHIPPKKPDSNWDPDPEPLPEEKNLSPSQLKDLGKKLCAEKKWLDAYRVYTTLLYIQDAPEEDKSIGLSNRSFICYNMGRFEDAKNDGLRCIKFRPNWAKGYMRAGNAFLALNDISKAVAAFKQGTGKEGDDGYMKNKLNELFLEMNAPNLVLKNNYYYSELMEFKKNYFSNPEKADQIYDMLQAKRPDVYNFIELDKVLEEINQIISKTWNYLHTADMFLKDQKFFFANCCYKLEANVKNGENEKAMMEKIKRNNEEEEKAFPDLHINKLAESVSPKYEASIALEEVVNIFHRYLIDSYYDKSPEFYCYFLDEVKNSEAQWTIDRVLEQKNTPQTFYREKDQPPKKGINYYWKFYMTNAGSFFVSLIADCMTLPGTTQSLAVANMRG